MSVIVDGIKSREDELLERVRELEALVQHMKHTTYCAYCGFEVTIDSPDSDLVVAEHIRTCDKHPLGERVRWLEKELLDLDSRSTGYRVRAERGEARVRELEAAVADATRAERERCLEAVDVVADGYFPPVHWAEKVRRAIEEGE